MNVPRNIASAPLAQTQHTDEPYSVPIYSLAQRVERPSRASTASLARSLGPAKPFYGEVLGV
jgi:hypothetical protein